MSLKVLSSLKDFQKNTNWPLYYYSQILKNKGYTPAYIEIFLRKLQKRMAAGQDPDSVLNEIAGEIQTENSLNLDPLQYPYVKPTDLAMQWAQYYRTHPEEAKEKYDKFDIGQFELDDIINESREWGALHYPVVDQLSDGFTMVKLVTNEAMLECGGELGVCVGDSVGAHYRENAVKGKEELWALVNPQGKTVVIVRVEIVPGKPEPFNTSEERRIEEIRAYKNRGYIYKGWAKLIDEWKSLHPEYIDRSRHMVSRNDDGDAAYDVRGGWGDDDESDWEDDYDPREDPASDEYEGRDEDEDYYDEEYQDPEEEIREDIGQLRYLYDDVSEDFLSSILDAIIENSLQINDSTLDRLFEDHEDFLPRALDHFITDEADPDPRLVKRFLENDETAPIFLQYIYHLYGDEKVLQLESDFNSLGQEELATASEYLPPEMISLIKNKLIKFFNNYDIQTMDSIFETQLFLSPEEKEEYIPKFLESLIPQMQNMDFRGNRTFEERYPDNNLYDIIKQLIYPNINNENIIPQFLLDKFLGTLFNKANNIYFVQEVANKKQNFNMIDFIHSSLLPNINNPQCYKSIANYAANNLIRYNKRTDSIEEILTKINPAINILQQLPEEFRSSFEFQGAATTVLTEMAPIQGLTSPEEFNTILDTITNGFTFDYIESLKTITDRFYFYDDADIIALARYVINKIKEQYGTDNIYQLLQEHNIHEDKINKMREKQLIAHKIINMLKISQKIDKTNPDISDKIDRLILSQTTPIDFKISKLQKKLSLKMDRAERQALLKEIMRLKKILYNK